MARKRKVQLLIQFDSPLTPFDHVALRKFIIDRLSAPLGDSIMRLSDVRVSKPIIPWREPDPPDIG